MVQFFLLELFFPASQECDSRPLGQQLLSIAKLGFVAAPASKIHKFSGPGIAVQPRLLKDKSIDPDG